MGMNLSGDAWGMGMMVLSGMGGDGMNLSGDRWRCDEYVTLCSFVVLMFVHIYIYPVHMLTSFDVELRNLAQ